MLNKIFKQVLLMIISVQTWYFLNKKGFIRILFTIFVACDTLSSWRLMIMCGMDTVNLHKLCIATLNVRPRCNSLKQRDKNLFRGAKGICISGKFSNISWRKVDSKQPWGTYLVCHECNIWHEAKSIDFYGKQVCWMFCSYEMPNCEW